MHDISLKSLIIRFKWRVLFTFLLVVIESLLDILYPLLIGLAINDLLDSKFNGVVHLAGLGVLSLIFGSARRFYDTRIYSGIYCQVAPEMVATEKEKGSSISKISARSNLLTEFVEFLENSMPEIIGGIVSLVGILAIISTLNLNVFFACIGLLVVMFVVYGLSGKMNYRLNANYNTQLEKQVEAIESNKSDIIKNHYSSLMKWNIKLSDLETINYFIIWISVIALFIYTPITVVEGGVLKYGLVFSIFMYVFDYTDKTVTFPLYVQQLIRLKEISNRLMK
jgi:ABC-type multidrug transport system fused ATPase/permease subunit